MILVYQVYHTNRTSICEQNVYTRYTNRTSVYEQNEQHAPRPRRAGAVDYRYDRVRHEAARYHRDSTTPGDKGITPPSDDFSKLVCSANWESANTERCALGMYMDRTTRRTISKSHRSVSLCGCHFLGGLEKIGSENHPSLWGRGRVL